LTERVTSLRSYFRISDVGRVVARTAYAQLRFSPKLLAFAAFAMTLLFAAPPLLSVFGPPAARPFAITSWIAMALMFQPTLRLYRVSPIYGLALPITGMLYLAFTLCSAYEHLRGRGGAWKGRTYPAAAPR
jgi:hypothetical protein